MKISQLSSCYVTIAVIALGAIVEPQHANAQRPLGIDVSSFQPGIDWTQVKASGVTWTVAKAAEATPQAGYIDPDPDFAYNEANAKAAGVLIGAYYYAHPEIHVGLAGADTEAAYFWSVAGPYIANGGTYLMPMLDFEQDVTSANPPYTTASLSAWVNEWCQDIVNYAAAKGVVVKPMVYTFISYANGTGGYGPGLDSSVTQWTLNMANVNFTTAQAQNPANGPAATYPWSTWSFWQYNWYGVVPGVSQQVDLDVFNGSAATLQNYVIGGSGVVFYYWDPQGTSGANPYTGSMTGNWESTYWSPSSSGEATPFPWVEGEAVCFGVNTGLGTPAYTVTAHANHTFAGIFIGPENPNSCSVTINGPGVLTLGPGDQGFYIIQAGDGSAGNLTVSNVIAGTSLIAAECGANTPGQIYLDGANTWSGGFSMGYAPASVPWTGVVNFGNNSAFGTGTLTLQHVGSGAALIAQGTSAYTIANPVDVPSSTTNNIVGNAAGVTFSGNWNLHSSVLQVGSGGAASNLVTISGIISGAGSFGKLNQSPSGILQLTGVNTYTGATANLSGTLKIGGAGQLGSGNYAGAFANSANFTYASTAAQTLSGVISGTGTLNQNGSGTLKLSGANSYAGATTINGGSLQLGLVNGVPSGSSVFVANGATFDLNGFSDSIATLGGTVGAAQPAGNVINNNGTLTINGTSVLNAGQAGSGAYSGVISGSGKVVVSGGGSTTFSGANTYGGTTTVSGGTLVPSYNGALPSGSAITVNSPGILDIVSVNETIPSLSGSGAVNLESGTLTVGGGNVSSIFSGVIRNSPATYNNGASVNGLQGFYYPAINFTGTPLIRVDATVNFSDFTQASQNPLYPTTNEISIRWLGQVLTTGTGGTYTFTTTSDDGSRCWVNGVLVVDNWAFQGATARSGTITLSANTMYDIRVEYMQGAGGASCVLSWTPPGGSSAVIPNANLFTYAGVGGLVKTGTGTLALSGANTYAGSTTISAGTLALGSAGSINNTALVSLAAGATFDVSAISSYTLGSSATLSASGASTPATIKGGTTVSLGSRPIILTYDGSHPTLTISQGTLSLNGNAFTVNGPQLVGGNVYTIVQQASGSIASSGTYSVSGTAIGAAGTTAAISVSGGNVNLVITDITTTTLNSLTPSTYGQQVTFAATVAPTPVGGTVQFYDNGVALGGPVVVSGGTASYTNSNLSVGSHPITASYSGTTGYAASSTTGSSTQQVNNTALSITANPQTKTYGALLTFGSGSTNFTASGLQNGETIGSVTLAVSGNGGATNAPVGTYIITPSQATGGTFTPANYNIGYNTGTLTVTPSTNTVPVTIVGVTRLADGTVQLNFTGAPGSVYLIEAATDLTSPITWTTLSTNTADTNGVFSFTDLSGSNYNNRYYRTATQ